MAALPAPTETRISDEAAAERAIEIERRVPFRLADGLRVELWASEALLGDPVGIDMDDQGRAHVAVSVRRKSSMFDIRSHKDWVERSWGWTEVADRKAFLREELAPANSARNRWLSDFNGDGSRDWMDLLVEEEMIYRVEDTSGDGRADASWKYLWGFSDEETDIVGTVLYRKGEVFVGVPPDVWRISDLDKDGAFDSKEAISSGYGIHIGLGGHGISGLKVGPDGRLYWGVGDIGFAGTDKDGRAWSFPRQGILARSEPDGSDFEVYAHGLRNTHEFDWDEFGNLIGVDNDGDHPGEDERIVYLIDGSDSGWRNNWQLGKYSDPKNNAYKVWMDEEYFKPGFRGQAAHLLPAIASYRSGPAGMAYNPGTALGEEWRGQFFVALFRGGAANSSIRAFSLEPKGASFALAKEREVLSGVTSAGIDFGPDGALYLADWKEGWGTDGIGRIWKLDTKTSRSTSIRSEVESLLKEGFEGRTVESLSELLGHRDRRVRRNAQFELVRRNEIDPFVSLLSGSSDRLARIHSIWGIAQYARREPEAGAALIAYLNDEDSEIRAQVAKMLGDIRYASAAEALISAVADTSSRVRLMAAEALGRLAYEPAFDSIVEMLEANDDRDAYLRAAGAIALERLGNEKRIAELSSHPSRAVRIAAVVALRRISSPSLADFLGDSELQVVTEAARGIGDGEFAMEALPALASVLATTPFLEEPLLRRAINANLYEGSLGSAERLAAFATRVEIPEPLRKEALDTLSFWADASVYDRVTGMVREVPRNTIADARAAVESVADRLLDDRSAAIRVAAVQAIVALGIEETGSELFALLESEKIGKARIAILEGLRELDYPGLKTAVSAALADEDRAVRVFALSMIKDMGMTNSETVETLLKAFENGGQDERQSAIFALGRLGAPEAEAALSEMMSAMERGEFDRALQLDLKLAIRNAEYESLMDRLDIYESTFASGDIAMRYQDALMGGDVVKGYEAFFYDAAAQCVRCHAIGGRGGEMGPDLSEVGTRLSRERILLSMIDPSDEVAPGYGTVVLSMKTGSSVAGIVKEETDTSITLASLGSEPTVIRKADIESREVAPSSMPPLGRVVSREDLRNLVEFLVSRKERASE